MVEDQEDEMDDYNDDDDFYGGTNLASDSVFRDGLEYLINNNGGVMYINTTEDINLNAGYIPLYSSSKINITIRGISEPDRPPPLINLRNYYIYVFGNIDLSLENLHIKGEVEYRYNNYQFINGVFYMIGDSGGCIGFENAVLSIQNCIFTDCRAANSGGSLFTLNSNLTVVNSIFENNVAGEENYGDNGGGGAIFFAGINNTLTLTNNQFHDNIGQTGGAIKINNASTINIQNSTFQSNIANKRGGGVYLSMGSLMIDNCDFAENYALEGGSIYIDGGDLNINGATVFDNNGAITGAVLYNEGASFYMEKVVMTNNRASSDAGAIFNAGTMTLVGCLFSNNFASNENNHNILSVAEYYHKLTLVANVFEDLISSEFLEGNLYAKIETCGNKNNVTKYNCIENTTCANQDIGYRCVCPAGTFQEGLYENIQCFACLPGTYCPDKATNVPSLCPVGSYCMPDKAFVCPVGYYCPSRNIIEPVKCATNNMSCPLGSVYNLTEIEVIQYNADIEFNDKEFNFEPHSVVYDDYTDYNTDTWNFQMKIIVICVIVLTTVWFVIALLITKYHIENRFINKLKTFDFFAMNHYHHIGVPIKKIKTILGGSVTILFLTSIVFVTWFYTLRYNYDNTEIIVTHVTNSTKNYAEFLDIGIAFNGVMPHNDSFELRIDNGIASTSKLSYTNFNHNGTDSSLLFQCNECKFNDDEIILSICSKHNDTYIRKIFWNASTPSFRRERYSVINGIILPENPIDEVWKNNGTDTPIIILFLKPVVYSNSQHQEEDNAGYAVEFQERFIGTTKNKCNFLEDNACEDNTTDNIIMSRKSYSDGICNADKVGLKIIIKRTIGYYDIRVKNRYMMMDLLAEVFAMLGASFAGIAYLLVGLEIVYPKTRKCKKKINRCMKCFSKNKKDGSKDGSVAEIIIGKEKYTEDIEDEVVAGLSLEVVGKVGEVVEEDTSDSSSSFSNISSTQTTAHRRHSTYQVSVV